MPKDQTRKSTRGQSKPRPYCVSVPRDPLARPSIPDPCVCCAAPETRRPPSKWPDGEPDYSRKRKADLKPAQKAKLLVEYSQLPTDKGGWKVGVGELCTGYGVNKNYVKQDLIPNVLASPDDADPFARAERSDKGVPKKLTPTKDAAMEAKAAEWAHDFSYQEMADYLCDAFDLDISRQAVAKHLSEQAWKLGVTSRAEPLLHDDLGHFEDRADFGRKHRKETWKNWVDVDEKWFYTMALRLLLKIPPGQPIPRRYIRHKSHVPKTMFLAALGRPGPDFDGKVGIWRVTKERPAKYNKHKGPNAGRKQGDPIVTDSTMGAKKYVEMMTTKVFPAIRKLYAGQEKVTVQHDGAPGHGKEGSNTVKQLVEAGKKRKRGEPLIELVRQPAQSPDFNICDLAFFRALSVAVRKRRRTTMRGAKKFDIDQLVEDVYQAYKEYDPDQLEKMWQHKSYVMGAVLTTQPKAGGSNYPKHDPSKKKLKF